MAVTKAMVEATLAVADEAALGAILDAAQVSRRGASTRAELAHRVADALWWNYCTPLGYVVDRTTLEDIVAHVAKRLKVSDRVSGSDGWQQLGSLTEALALQVGKEATHGVREDQLDPKVQQRLRGTWWATIAYGSGATGSLSARWTAVRVLKLAASPIGRLIPLIPPLRPYYSAIVKGASAVRLVAGPLGIALTVLAVNDALGTNYHRLVPLLLGIGVLGPEPVDDAEEVAA